MIELSKELRLDYHNELGKEGVKKYYEKKDNKGAGFELREVVGL